MKRRSLAVLLVATVLLSVAAPAIAAQASTSPSGINIGSDAVPDAQIDVDVQKVNHEMGWSPVAYENNNGEKTTLEASVNGSADNPVSYVPTDVEVDDFGQFPRKSAEDGNNTASALDASEWTKDATGSAGSGTIADVTTAPGVEAVSVSTSGQSSSDVMTFSYSNFSITSDEEKRNLQLAADVNALDSGAHVEVRVVDADGDYKTVVVDSDNSTSSADVLANATGEGYVLQEQLGQLDTTTAGDGTFSDIESIEVHISDANADVDFALINAENLGEYNFGTQADDGDEDETQTLNEPNGRVSVTALDTLGDTFADATFHNAEWDLQFQADDLETAMDVHWNTSGAEAYPNYDHVADVYFRLQLPAQYDLSYTNAELVGTQDLPSDRYQAVEVSEGISDTDFENVSSWTDKTSTFSSTGDHVLDSTVQVDQQIGVHAEMLWTQGDYDAALGGAGGAGQFQEDGGGIVGWIMGAIGSVLVALGIRKKRG